MANPWGNRGVFRQDREALKPWYNDRVSGIQIASFHHYESMQGKRITRFDPKFLIIDEIEYHVRGKDKPEPDRIGNEAINRILGKRRIAAKFTYLHHVSEKTRKLWKEQVRNRLVRIGILESRDW